jgi:hypothetical protein
MLADWRSRHRHGELKPGVLTILHPADQRQIGKVVR